MSRRKLTRRIVIALASIALLAVGATAVTAATSGTQTTSKTPVGEPDANKARPVFHPCTLVTASDAQAIDPTVTSAVEARLGPSCVYYRRGNKEITLTLEQRSLQTATGKLNKGVPLTVANHAGICARLATDTLFVSLTGGRALTIGAPCALAQRLAAKALTRLPG